MYYYFSNFIVQSASVFTLGKPFCQAHCVTRHLGRLPTQVNLRCVNPASDVPSFPMEILVPTITTWHIIRTALTFIDMHFSCIDMLGVYLYKLSQLAGWDSYKNGYISNIHIVVGCTCICTLWNGNFLWLFWCFRKAMDSQKEMKLLLDMYKSAPKEQKDKVQVFIRFYLRSSVIGRKYGRVYEVISNTKTY